MTRQQVKRSCQLFERKPQEMSSFRRASAAPAVPGQDTIQPFTPSQLHYDFSPLPIQQATLSTLPRAKQRHLSVGKTIEQDTSQAAPKNVRQDGLNPVHFNQTLIQRMEVEEKQEEKVPPEAIALVKEHKTHGMTMARSGPSRIRVGVINGKNYYYSPFIDRDNDLGGGEGVKCAKISIAEFEKPNVAGRLIITPDGRYFYWDHGDVYTEIVL
ncbi:hypothetical protein [Synechococcus sp. PCC 7336]|uniref:hypothetical protein n=1 Tax=Synechococcus sp. PCC 7336 TaxID=195250 RepID=UPI00056E0F7D|nr:hypothetical protein [Synechococcus sp. PCC 7336]